MKNWVCLTNSYFAFSSCLTFFVTTLSQSGVKISGYVALRKIDRTKTLYSASFSYG